MLSCVFCAVVTFTAGGGGASKRKYLSVNLATRLKKSALGLNFQGSVSRGHESPHQISQSCAHDAMLAALDAAKKVGVKSENSFRLQGSQPGQSGETRRSCCARDWQKAKGPLRDVVIEVIDAIALSYDGRWEISLEGFLSACSQTKLVLLKFAASFVQCQNTGWSYWLNLFSSLQLEPFDRGNRPYWFTTAVTCWYNPKNKLSESQSCWQYRTKSIQFPDSVGTVFVTELSQLPPRLCPLQG